MLTLSFPDEQQLTNDACREIEAGHQRCWKMINPSSASGYARAQWEQNFVAHLCVSMADVAKAWRRTLRKSHPGSQLALSTIFTHQSPYVKWTPGTNRCELADVLLAFVDHSAGPPDGRAVLVQAKQSDTGSVRLSTPSEKCQFELLSKRPIFDVDASNAPRAVDLGSKTPDVALEYGLTPPDAKPSGSPPTGCCWHTAHGLNSVKKHTVSASTCLATTMIEMVKGNVGWKFVLPTGNTGWKGFQTGSAKDDWSALINYLLDRTFKRPVSVLRKAGGSTDRHRKDRLYLTARSPKGDTMFMLRDVGTEALKKEPLEWLETTEEEGAEGWNGPFGDAMPADSLGGGGDEHGGAEEYIPEDGPISVILFEFNSRQG